MDLNASGKFLKKLRISQKLTQRQIADKLNVCPKTVSKWETGRGFPDITTINSLAQILGVSSESVLSGNLKENKREAGNMKKIKFYMCPICGNIITQTNDSQMMCCGKKIMPLKIQEKDANHCATIQTVEEDLYITFNHEMSKEHFINFVAYVKDDRIYLVKLYPEQNAEVRIPQINGAKLYCCCIKHGLFSIN